MKKATFIAVMATAVVMLTGCSGKTPGQVQQDAEKQNSDVIIEQYGELLQNEKDLKAKDDEITKLKKQIEESEAADAEQVESESDTIKDLTEENEDLKERIEELEKTGEQSKQIESKNEKIKALTKENEDLKKQVEELKASAKQEIAEKTNSSATMKNDETAKVPLIPKDKEKIRVSALYHDNEIPLNVATEGNRSESINKANVITVKDANGKDVKDRDLSIVIDGVSVSNVYVVDKEFKEVEDLSYDSVDNTYSAYYYMPRGGQYTFLIQTTNGNHYYVSVVY